MMNFLSFFYSRLWPSHTTIVKLQGTRWSVLMNWCTQGVQHFVSIVHTLANMAHFVVLLKSGLSLFPRSLVSVAGLSSQWRQRIRLKAQAFSTGKEKSPAPPAPPEATSLVPDQVFLQLRWAHSDFPATWSHPTYFSIWKKPPSRWDALNPGVCTRAEAFRC